MRAIAPNDVVAHQVRDALTRMYDLAYLETHPLAQQVAVPGAAGERGRGRLLQQTLEAAIASLRQGASAPGSRAERAYALMQRRYVDGSDVATVHTELAISRREYYREHGRALAALVVILETGWRPTERSTSSPGAVGQGLVGAPLGAQPARIPGLLTRFFGRERELALLGQMVAQHRLVTVVGPPGTGKTRLVTEAAPVLGRDFPDGVRFVALAGVQESPLVLSALAETLRIQQDGEQTIESLLRATLARQHMLLILDNFEHVLEAAPGVADLLQHCPGIHLLVTSRARLSLVGEHELALAPLGVTDDPDAEVEESAVALFVDRVQQHTPDFRLTPAARSVVRAICRRVDGLPLAIELAAARARLISLEDLERQLADGIGILSGGPRDAPPRQRDIRAAIAWSYSLLDRDAQALLGQLAVCWGGWELEAATGVSETGDGALELLDALQGWSFIQRQDAGPSGHRSRFRMLETIRAYSIERLVDEGRADAARDRHAAYFLAWAERAASYLRGQQQNEWLARFETEHDNIRAALRWLDERQDVEGLLRLATATFLFWYTRGHYTEGRERLSAALALVGAHPVPPRIEAAACEGLANLMTMNLQLCVSALPYVERAYQIQLELGDLKGAAFSEWHFGRIAMKVEGPGEKARHYYAKSLQTATAAGDVMGMARAHTLLGGMAEAAGDDATALRHGEEGLRLQAELGPSRGHALALSNLARIAIRQHRYGTAREHLTASLLMARAQEHGEATARGLEGFALLALAEAQPERGLQLAGAARVLREHWGVPAVAYWSQPGAFEKAMDEARETLPPDRGQAAWQQGAAMTAAEATALALSSYLGLNQSRPSIS